MPNMYALGVLMNAMGGGGDRGQAFPASDTDDFGKGARYIPSEVTLARRRGERVVFVQQCGGACCWYWEFRSGKRQYHFDRITYDSLNGAPCQCGNTHTGGEAVTPNVELRGRAL